MKYKKLIFGVLLGMVLFLVSLAFHMFRDREKTPEPALTLLPDEEMMANLSYRGINLFQGSSCSCEKMKGLAVYQLEDYVKKDEIEMMKERRSKEMKHFKKRFNTINNNVLIAAPNSPLSYPIHGIQVIPLHTILIEGLSVSGQRRDDYKVTLQASLGIFNTMADAPEEQVQGRGTNTLMISSTYLSLLNHILRHIIYTSTVYNINTMDVVKFQMREHEASFPVMIRQPQIPVLFDAGSDQNISSLVTITTKTFLRYDKLRNLIKSIQQFYPDIKIIVADDNEDTEKIQEKNVEQYFMPFAKGWFAGRNLAVSQVTTKYFLWVDDDFLFIEQTKLENFVRVLEETDLDVVGGLVDGGDFTFKLFYQEGDEDGGCVHKRSGGYHKLEGFPNCLVAGVVVNFFMAHTRRALAAGFDPKIQRAGHSQFFTDGVGSLNVGACNDVMIRHQRKTAPKTDKERSYSQYRHDSEQRSNAMRLLYFKNNLKCFTDN
ncbi:beta-1,4 N-acetylgalactosaminyltransferase 2-like [Discoglossus pictus]